jgi:hypothetical protein
MLTWLLLRVTMLSLLGAKMSLYGWMLMWLFPMLRVKTVTMEVIALVTS